jgi:hypothetical protein
MAIPFSKKAENHAHAVSLAFMAYNFCTWLTVAPARSSVVE